MAMQREKFRRVGVVLNVGYRDNEGDFLHQFSGKPIMYANEEGDMIVIKGAFRFTHKTGFVDKKR